MVQLLRFLLKILFRVRISGSGPAPSKLLIVANHVSALDGVVLGMFMPGNPLVIVPASDLEHWPTRLLFRWVPHQVLDPDYPLTLKKVVQMLEKGRPVVIFPEHLVTPSGTLMKVYETSAWLASRKGVAILPVYIENAGKLSNPRYRHGLAFRRLPRFTLQIQPITALPLALSSTKKQRRQVAVAELQRIMRSAIVFSGTEQTLVSAFLSAAKKFGWHTQAIEDIKGKQSYRQLFKTGLALGKWASRRTGKNETVGVLLPNLNSTVSAMLGLMVTQRVPAIINYTAGMSGIEAACQAAQLSTIITSRAFISAIKLRPENLPVACLFLEDFQLTLPDKLWVSLAMRQPPLGTAKADDAAVVLFTSGSESTPKGVVLSHRAMLSNIKQLKAVIDFSENDKFLNPLPMHHAYGLTVGTFLPMLAGAQLFIYPSPLHYRHIPELAYRWGATYLFGTSAFLGHYAKHAHPVDFRSVRYVISGGEKLNQEVSRIWMEKFGLRILEGYGAAECAPVIAFNTPMAYQQGSVGQFLPGIEHRSEPLAGIAHGGVLHLRGPNLMLGHYLCDQPGVLQPPLSLFGPGWHRTGDVVEVDNDGFVTIQGRVKRFAKIAGEMVSLEVVEKIAHHASPRHRHAATLKSDLERGEIIQLFTTDPALDRLLLSRAARELGHPELAVARQLVHLAELPLLAIGKVDYVQLQHLAQQLPGHANTTPS